MAMGAWMHGCMERVDCSQWPTSWRHQLNLSGGMFRAHKLEVFHLLCSYIKELLAEGCWCGYWMFLPAQRETRQVHKKLIC